jgi:hypothetical protein
VLGLLRWPQPNQHKAMPLPLVSMSREGRSLTLLARSVDEYLHRCVLGGVWAVQVVRGLLCVGRLSMYAWCASIPPELWPLAMQQAVACVPQTEE